MERRLHTRHRSRTQLFIKIGQKRTRVNAINISAGGVAVKSETPLNMRVGTVCELAFTINLGLVTKIHRRIARVVYVRNGITGFAMEAFVSTERKHASA